MRRYIKHTKDSLEPLVNSCYSFREVLLKLGLKPAGGNFSQLQKNIERFGLDTSHMLHQGINRGKEFVPFDALTKPASIKKRLLKEREYICECCGISSWNDRPLTLEMDHIDGNTRNNIRENLRILCPNCHSQTPTYRNTKR